MANKTFIYFFEQSFYIHNIYPHIGKVKTNNIKITSDQKLNFILFPF